MLNLIHTEEADTSVETVTESTIDANQVRTDGGTQMRDQLNMDTVAEYRDTMLAQDGWGPFPPVVVFHDGADHWLADGFHRIAAIKSARPTAKVPADIRAGTRQDAILHAAGANAKHGLRRTPADKRRAVETLLASDDWATWSDRQIARACNVSPTFVGKIRSALAPADDAQDDGLTVHVDSEKPTKRTYVTKHGTVSTMNTGDIGRVKPPADDAQEDGFDKVVEPQPLTSAEIVAIASHALERGTPGDQTLKQKIAWLEKASVHDFYAARDAARDNDEVSHQPWKGRPFDEAEALERFEILKEGLQRIVNTPNPTQPVVADPDTLPEWAADDKPDATDAPVSITISQAAAVQLHYYLSKFLVYASPNLSHANEVYDALDAVIATPAQSQAASSKQPTIDLSAWNDDDQAEYDALPAEWSTEKITRPLVALRLIEDESDTDLHTCLWKRHTELTGG